jgi:CRP/FNR family transcriptional regulator, anaerobic regulatory protein
MKEKFCHTGEDSGCSQCHTKEFCLPLAMDVVDLAKLDGIVLKDHILQKGEYAFRFESPFTAFYAIRYGQIKTYHRTPHGEEQVTGFYFPGDIFGLDGIGEKKFMSSAKALEATSICEIDFARFQHLIAELPELQAYFLQLMSHEIIKQQELITLRNKNTAEQRIATFLLFISQRNVQRKLSPMHFRLAMTRKEIGNYLGLTVETVSRTFTRFIKADIIADDKKDIVIKDLEHLRSLAELAILIPSHLRPPVL